MVTSESAALLAGPQVSEESNPSDSPRSASTGSSLPLAQGEDLTAKILLSCFPQGPQHLPTASIFPAQTPNAQTCRTFFGISAWQKWEYFPLFFPKVLSRGWADRGQVYSYSYHSSTLPRQKQPLSVNLYRFFRLIITIFFGQYSKKGDLSVSLRTSNPGPRTGASAPGCGHFPWKSLPDFSCGGPACGRR